MHKATLGDDVFGRLLDLIYSGELPPGAELNEVALAERFAVSRGPVREAVRRLQGVQLVSRAPFLRARVITLEPTAVRELFEVREALEGYACRLAAELMTDDEIAALMEGLEANNVAAGSQARISVAAAFDFHERVVRASRNRRIIDALCGDLYHLLRLYRRWSGAAGERKAIAYTEHRQILLAIRARDADLAESLMRSHISRAAENLVDHLPPPAAPAADDRSAASGRRRRAARPDLHECH
ncbi:FCD domain-containing protein [Rhodoplanes serenus]|jgi:DNA-binding GntR family transcriptional regulator|uniref:D-xylose utilization operon transcriptional repressor n=1 Tax=Rhodoplanes serenus TaxID=200615 RepID=A0A327K645_9BRAD|nr:GntR family transcriptional regulator [Rhodoplanes serenus]MBI5113785.1 GntR family transcriptional regulator [Rhodovulum sp.]MTW17646.1 FCD domain-containing protein [Rhodoplanes serenus]RAI33384.1 GntR family transcriptional regulator [Rhodoplanes serenus]VCU10164.1 putative D-xylose utilization operon transcriptional repressor [Rhodoplanes serenus]